MPSRPSIVLSYSCLFVLLSLGAIPATGQGARTVFSPATTANLPVNFEPNQGQTGTSARFIVRTSRIDMALRATGIDLVIPGKDMHRNSLGIEFVSSNADVDIAATEQSTSESNYLIGNDPLRWRTHIPNFGRITYRGIYPGIDLAFYGSGQQLEHDFIVAPQADYRIIRMHLAGSQRLRPQGDGSLQIALPEGDLIFEKPEVYQLSGTRKQTREGRFLLLSENEFGFAVGDYDRSRPLIIDPVLSFSTYLADLGVGVSGVATDLAGNTFVTGYTFSASFPTTAGAVQQPCKSCPDKPDVFITKLNANGTGLVYSTLLGGSDYDTPVRIAVDANGNAVVAGYTQSADFPVKNGVMTVNPGNGSQFAFVTSLSADGSKLNYSSLLGGGAQAGLSSSTGTGGMALDSSGNAYISGVTDSPVFPVTNGALNLTTPAYPKEVVFVTKFLTTGTLAYSALLGDVAPQNGGGGPIGVFGVGVDPAGSAYVIGNGGTLWPTTGGAYQRTIPGSSPYAAPFVTKISPAGSNLVYSTFLGSSGAITGIAVKSTGEAFVTGNSAPADFPTTANAFKKTLDGSCCSGFITEFNATGSQLIYSTFFYGSLTSLRSATYPTGVALDGVNNLWIVGTSSDPALPLIFPLQSTIATTDFPATTAFLSRFDPTGATLTFSSFFGGTGQGGEISGIAIDSNNKAHIAGTTGTDLFTTPGAHLASVTPAPPNIQYTFGYAAVIDPDAAAPSLCFNGSGVAFGPVRQGTSSSFALKITNCGNQALGINSMTSSDSQFTVPAATNGCTQSVATGASCTVSVVFTPTSLNLSLATLTIRSNASVSSTQLTLQGSGGLPQIQVQGTSVTFDSQFVGQTSPQQFVTVSNTGSVPLNIDLAHTTISAGFGFSQSGCDQPIFQNGFPSCVFILTFTPTTSGSLSGTFTIASDDPTQPKFAVGLTGTGYTSYPSPTIAALRTPTVPVGGTSISVEISGSNFFPASVVRVSGIVQVTSYHSSTSLSATIDSSLLTKMSELPLTVFNPTPGGGESAPVTLTVYATIPLAGSALTYDPFTQRLFASIPAQAASHPNTVAIIDPSSAQVLSYISVGNDPHRMAVSDDGKYLYVGLNGDHAVQRINLTSGLIEKSFALPVDPSYGQLIVADIKAVPGAPKSFVAALFRIGVSPPEEGIALFDDTGLLSGPVNPLPDRIGAVDNFVFAGNPPKIYSMPPLGVFTFDAAGLHPQLPETISGTIQQIGSTAATDGTLIYTSAGVVWNPTTQTLVGQYNPPLLNGGGVVPDSSGGRTFFLNPISQNVEGGATSVDAYDQASFAFAGFVGFPELPGVDVVDLTRWGTDGFAFLVGSFVNAQGTDQLILFRSSIAHASISQNLPPVLTALGTSTVAGGSPSFVLSVTGSSFVHGSVVEWNGSARTTTYVSATQLSADIPSSDVAQAGSAQITVANPGGGISAALALTIVPPPVVTLNPASLVFASQPVKSTSTVQTLTLANNGGAALLLDGIQTSGDFAATNNCGTSLAPLASCTISVDFTPSLIGSRQGSVALYDNAGGSPQIVMLSGTGAAPTFSFATGGSVVTAATVAAGQTAAYSLSMAADTAYSGTVSLSCVQVPTNARCTVNPTSLVLKNGSSASFTVSVSTGSSTVASLAVRLPLTSAACGFAWLLFFLRKRWLSGVRQARLTFIAAAMLAAFIVMMGCGGGSSAPSTPPASLTTPAGTYTLQIVATDGTTSHTQPIQLVVR